MWKVFAFSYKNGEFCHLIGTTDYYCNYRHDAVVQLCLLMIKEIRCNIVNLLYSTNSAVHDATT